jgi:sortase (surface protein transpeptidase)
MQTLRTLALFMFVAGLGLLVIGFVYSSNSDADEEPDDAIVGTFEIVAPPTRTPTPPSETPTAPPPDAPTPTATPAPYNGEVARMKIPKFGVDSAVETIGYLAGTENQLDTPRDPLNTGWYDLYDKPGFNGNAVFSAHVDYYPNILGPFNKLAQSEIGDEIIVTMDNGLEYHYKVIKIARYDVTNIPMGELVWPTNKPADADWITLITCGGEFRAITPGGPGEYLQRDVVVAERVKT